MTLDASTLRKCDCDMTASYLVGYEKAKNEAKAEIERLKRQLALCKEQRDYLVECSEGNRLQKITWLDAELEATE